MNIAYMIYQAERTRTAAEQREADRCNGELAASLAGLWRSLATPLRLLRRAQHTGPAGLAAGPHHANRRPGQPLGFPGQACPGHRQVLDE